jgi:signal peptidase I
MSVEERRVAAELSRGQGARPVDDTVFSPPEPAASFAPLPPLATGGGYGAAPAPALPSAEAPPKKGSGALRAVREIVETLLLALVIFLGVRLLVLNFKVDGESMVPSLLDQQMLLVNVNAYKHFDLNQLLNVLPGEDRTETNVIYPFSPPERGDIIVFEPPVRQDPGDEKPYIKRIIGLPGERITFEGGRVLINGQPLEEPYLDPDATTRCGRAAECDLVVRPGHVYVLGDNREHSSDSRSFGDVAVDRIIGKAWFSYWPSDDIGLVPHQDYDGVPEHALPSDPAAVPVDGAAATPAAASDDRAGKPKRDRGDKPKRSKRNETPEAERDLGGAAE